MEFGKLSDISLVDFSFPADPTENNRLLQQQATAATPSHWYIGCTGWAMKEWVGTVYPKHAKPADYLTYYGQQFNTIELNTTHYRIPDTETIAKWVRQTPDDFRFCPKIPQGISHSRDLGISSGQIRYFADTISGLGHKLGSCFLQLPPHVRPDSLGVIQQFLEQWPSELPLALEFRHPDWFADQTLLPAAADLLEKHHIGTVITDVAGRRDALHLRLTTPIAMVRFVGNDFHPTDYSRVQDWSKRIRLWVEQGLHAVYFFAHEPDNVKGPELAQYVLEQAKQIPGVRTRGPKWSEPEAPKQLGLF